ncbi:ABC transporter substrate-binding protein [Neomicrococcus lactis]
MRIAMRSSIVAGLAVTALALSACGSSTPSSTSSSASSANSSASSASGASSDAAKTAKSAADLGGMDKLIEAAKAEGQLNVIALPHDWANYGEIIEGFKTKYGITVNESTPDASSKEEIQAADANKGTDKAPDVFDLGTTVTLESKDYFAPYKVENFDKIPAENKDADGLYLNDYTGVMVVGYNKTQYGEITSLDQLTDTKFDGAVAVNGKPAEAGAAFNGFLLANLANGGTLDDGTKGLEYFKKLKDAGTLNQSDVTKGTIESGEHGVVFDWTYNQLSYTSSLKEKGVEWATFVPNNISVVSYYNQAINKDAPHPAAARLWQEYLFSAEAQNLWLKGGASPVLAAEMKKAGTLNAEFEKNVPAVTDPQTPTADQAEKMNKFLADNWDKTMGQ